MDLLKIIGREGFARHQKAIVFQYLKGFCGIKVPYCIPLSLCKRLHDVVTTCIQIGGRDLLFHKAIVTT